MSVSRQKSIDRSVERSPGDALDATRHDALAKVIAELRAASWQSLVATAAQIKAARKTTIIFLKVVIMSRFGRRVASHRIARALPLPLSLPTSTLAMGQEQIGELVSWPYCSNCVHR